MISQLKGIVEAIGLIPILLGYFKLTPNWFTPSEFYEPDIYYWALGASLVTFVLTIVYCHRINGPITAWLKADRAARFVEVVVAVIASVLSGIAYVVIVRNYPNASVGVDIAQMATWSGVFVALTFAGTAMGCIWKAP